MNATNIDIKPIGEVISDVEKPLDMPLTGHPGIIKIYPEYSDALDKITENSHLWIISWFHKGNRDVLKVAPKRMSQSAEERGVFGLRCFSRPNPMGLSLVELVKLKGNLLYLADYDAIAGTPVLDIKPYFEQDVIYSPKTPNIRADDPDVRFQIYRKLAFKQHREYCKWLDLGVRMAMIVEEEFGNLKSEEISVEVEGHPCLADTIQALTRARFSNPPRFKFKEDKRVNLTRWANQKDKITLKLCQILDDSFATKSEDELFEITHH